MNAIERMIDNWRFNVRILERGVDSAFANPERAEAMRGCADELERLYSEVIEPMAVALNDARKIVRGRHSTIPYGPQELVNRIDAALARYREDATSAADPK